MTGKRLEAAAWGVPVGMMGGLVGLGGGEFRIPILLRRFGLAARDVIPLNAVISLATLAGALAFRGGTLTLAPLALHIADIAALALGGMLAAVLAGGLSARLSKAAPPAALLALLVAT